MDIKIANDIMIMIERQQLIMQDTFAHLRKTIADLLTNEINDRQHKSENQKEDGFVELDALRQNKRTKK
jgi:hypothetical protein